MEKDCIFCKIIAGKVPCTKIYENDKVFCFLDINPINKGHALVLPKKHYEFLEEIPEDILCELTKTIKKISSAVVKVVGAPAFNLSLNNGKEAGQFVPHTHFHIMPRFKNDGLKLDWPAGKYLDGEAESVAEKIKKELSKRK